MVTSPAELVRVPPVASSIGLYVIVVNITNAARRRRVRQLLGAHGERVHPDSYEIPTNSRGLRPLVLALTPELRPGDIVRVYPVCARCQSAVQLYGEGELAHLPVAFVY